MSPLVSIIIPTYNRYHLIGETLDSIISQTFQNWECIVVDDNSDDHTKELLEFYCEKDKRFRFFVRPEYLDKGANTCRNYGLQQIKGDLVNWFDSDDLMVKLYLEKQLNNLEDGEFDCSICDFTVFKDNLNESLITVYNKSSDEDFVEDFITGKINPGLQGTIWKRKTIIDYTFNETLTWADDLDYLFKISRDKKLKINFLQESLILLRRHDNSLTINYHQFDLKKIESELEVRRAILSYAYKKGLEKEKLLKVLEIYFDGFKKLFLMKELIKIKKEVELLKEIFSLKHSVVFWEMKLFQLLFFSYLPYSRVSFQNHLKKFSLSII